MLEKLADHDDELMEQLLSDMEPPRDRVFGDLSRELAEGLITPVLFGSAEHGNGIGRLLKALRHEVPGVAETAERLGLKTGAGTVAQVLKTFHTAHGGKLSLVRRAGGRGRRWHGLPWRAGPGSRVPPASSPCWARRLDKIAKASAGDTVALGRLEAHCHGRDDLDGQGPHSAACRGAEGCPASMASPSRCPTARTR